MKNRCWYLWYLNKLKMKIMVIKKPLFLHVIFFKKNSLIEITVFFIMVLFLKYFLFILFYKKLKKPC